MLNAGDALLLLPRTRQQPPPMHARPSVLPDDDGTDRELRSANQYHLRDLKRAHGNEMGIFCSHDSRELAALKLGGLNALRTLSQSSAPHRAGTRTCTTLVWQEKGADRSAPLVILDPVVETSGAGRLAELTVLLVADEAELGDA